MQEEVKTQNIMITEIDEKVDKATLHLQGLNAKVKEALEKVVFPPRCARTRAVLLQVISEQEERSEPVMSEDFLAQVIRSYGGTMQGFIGQYLEQSLRLFLQQQQQMNQRMRSMVGYDPSGITQANLAQDNFQRWKETQDELLKGFLDAGKP
jgi:polyhydroxyalkanoate synthesis repressor PhaR